MILNGIFQSPGYPTLMAMFNSYFTSINGFIMGIWIADTNLGFLLA